jgi:hypothetical protein
MRARQKSRMFKVVITRTETNAELREQCYKGCEETAKEEIMDCNQDFNDSVRDLPASEFPNGSAYQFYEAVRDNCILIAEAREYDCKDSCDKIYPDEKK